MYKLHLNVCPFACSKWNCCADRCPWFRFMQLFSVVVIIIDWLLKVCLGVFGLRRTTTSGGGSCSHFPVGQFESFSLLGVQGGNAGMENVFVGLHLLQDVHHSDALFAGGQNHGHLKGLGDDGDDTRKVAVVGAQNDRMIGLDEVAEIAVDV